MYRQATQNDIPQLVELRIAEQKEDWGEEYAIEHQDFADILRDFLEKKLNQEVFFFVKEMEGKLVAKCGLQIFYYLPQCVEPSGKKGYLSSVYTLPEFRRQGIQKKLLQMTLDFAKKEKLENITLEADNPHAIALYKSAGFEEVDYSFMKI